MAEINMRLYIEQFLKIKDKEQKIVPFVLNAPQIRLYEAIKKRAAEKKAIKIIVLKARQMGFSTFITAMGTKRINTSENVTMAIVAHEEKATKNLYEMIRRYYENLPVEIKPRLENYTGYGLKYGDLKSNVTLYTAGNESIGRSATINFLHASEVAFWKGNAEDTLDGLLQAVPNNEFSFVALESTANGFNLFKDLWDRAVEGLSDYIPFFAAWFELDEYQMDDTGFVINDDVARYGDEQQLKDTYNLTNRQLAWRRWKINDLRGDLQKFRQEYPSNPLEAFIFSGDSVFNTERVIAHLEYVKKHVKPLKTGYFTYMKTFNEFGIPSITDIKWVDDIFGKVLIYEEPKTEEDDEAKYIYPYAIGGDIAGVGEDYFTANVINNVTKRDAATYRVQRIDEVEYAEQVYCLHKYYHDALIGIETNYSTVATRELHKLNASQYRRENVDTTSNVYTDAIGFKTTTLTRPVIIEEFKELIRDDISIVLDQETLQEMLTFIKDDKGKAQAIDGKHDDMIMAKMICHHISQQQRSTRIKIEKPKVDVIKAFFGRDKDNEGGGIDEW
jgi:hypothetical protein